MKYIFAVILSLPSLFAFSQTASRDGAAPLFPLAAYPQDYFRDPLDIPMSLAANFGELRPNHYHMGLDIRTQHKENLSVYAAADGYVARVEIEPGGFGQAIYIRHPDGYTTVYGHLNQFFPALAAYVHEQQYRQQSWSVDLAIPPALFPVRKGEFIAYSGSTGGSQGPHLHFEIRLTAGDINLNPLLFGLPVPDRTAPTLLRLAWYDRNQGIYEQSPHILPVRTAAASHAANPRPVVNPRAAVAASAVGSLAFARPVTAAWSIFPSLLTVPASRISFALSAFDTQSGSANPNGIFQAILYDDDQPVIGFQMDSISYDNTRNINAHIDYKTRETGGPFLQHLSFLPGYPPPSIYRIPAAAGSASPGRQPLAAGNAGPSVDPGQAAASGAHPASGVIDLRDGRRHSIRVEVRDPNGNLSTLRFQVQYQSPASSPAAPTASIAIPAAGKRFYPGMVDGFETEDCAFYLGEKSLYDSVVLAVSVSGYPGAGHSLPGGVSAVYSIGAPWIPLLDPVLVRLRLAGKSSPGPDDKPAAIDVPSIVVDKVVMVCFRGSEKDVKRPEWKDGWASARFREFGSFELVEDTIAPVITPIGPLEGADLSHAGRIAFNIKDNLGALRNFRAELDGAWLCCTNDKGLAYIYTFDEHCPSGRHTLKVTVEDVAGNRTTKAYTFTR
jgi:murein DD-endopeptidase MepM/ murein hydrolase activator NlpD